MQPDVFSKWMTQQNTEGFIYNCLNGIDYSNLEKPFELLIQMLPSISIIGLKTYRSRKIDFDKDVNTGKGICWDGEKLIGGFIKNEAGIVPPKYCKMGRLNRDSEPVFYVTEERDTSIKEQKLTDEVFLSIGEFTIVNEIQILDFSLEQSKLISDEEEKSFLKQYELSARELYAGMCRFLTILDSCLEYYEVSNAIVDLIKKCERIDGIRYSSFYGGHNLGIWNYRPEDYLFGGSYIIKTNGR